MSLQKCAELGAVNDEAAKGVGKSSWLAGELRDATIVGQDAYTIQNEPSGSFQVVGTDSFALVDEFGNVV